MNQKEGICSDAEGRKLRTSATSRTHRLGLPKTRAVLSRPNETPGPSCILLRDFSPASDGAGLCVSSVKSSLGVVRPPVETPLAGDACAVSASHATRGDAKNPLQPVNQCQTLFSLTHWKQTPEQISNRHKCAVFTSWVSSKDPTHSGDLGSSPKDSSIIESVGNRRLH